MTPPRLTALKCPKCQQVSWVLESDYRGMDGPWVPYVERRYACLRCRHHGPGWIVGQQSPPAFLLQPHDLYPMTQAAFDYWVDILRTHFPTHPLLTRLGTTFRPRLPEEVEAIRQAHERAHPVFEMQDQDGARRADPDPAVAGEWLEIMNAGDTLAFRRRDGSSLHVMCDGVTHSARWLDRTGTVLAEMAAMDEQTARRAIERYLSDDAKECASGFAT
jgi:hypothetical protein